MVDIAMAFLTLGLQLAGCETVYTHLYLVPRLRMHEVHLHSPIRLHGMVLNYMQDMSS
jgi:hypothetical protein